MPELRTPAFCCLCREPLTVGAKFWFHQTMHRIATPQGYRNVPRRHRPRHPYDCRVEMTA